MHRASFRFALLLIAIAIAACNHRVDAPQLGVYRAVLRLPGGDTPFGFEVAQQQQHHVLYLKNGTDRQRRRRRHLGGDVHERQGRGFESDPVAGATVTTKHGCWCRSTASTASAASRSSR